MNDAPNIGWVNTISAISLIFLIGGDMGHLGSAGTIREDFVEVPAALAS